MNILTLRRLWKSVDKKIGNMEKARRRAKDKERWDKNNLAKLASLRMVRNKTEINLIRALQAQGQFSHDDLNGSRALAHHRAK